MTVRRLVAIALSFAGASIAWSVLGSSLMVRTGENDSQLGREVQLLWGGQHRQVAPDAWIQRPVVETEIVETKDEKGGITRREVKKPALHSVPAPLESTRADVDLDLAHRQKGLLWYATYTVAFKSTYTFRNPDSEPRELHVRFPLPAQDDRFAVALAEPGQNYFVDVHVRAVEGARAARQGLRGRGQLPLRARAGPPRTRSRP